MALHGVFCCGLLAVALFQHRILQTAGQGDNALFLGVLSQIFLASLLMGLAGLGTLSLELLLLFLEIVLNDGLGLTV